MGGLGCPYYKGCIQSAKTTVYLLFFHEQIHETQDDTHIPIYGEQNLHRQTTIMKHKVMNEEHGQ